METGRAKDGLALRTSRRRIFFDRGATLLVRVGGLVIVACILGLLAFLLVESLPLMQRAEAGAWRRPRFEPGPMSHLVLLDDTASRLVVAGDDGLLRVLDSSSGAQIAETRAAAGGAAITSMRVVDASAIACATDDGRISLQTWVWIEDRSGDALTVRPDFGERRDVRGQAACVWTAAHDRESESSRIVWLADGRMHIESFEMQRGLLGAQRVERSSASRAADADIILLALSSDLEQLYGVTARGDLLWWQLAGDDAPKRLSIGAPAVTALQLLLGDNSLIVGRADGSLEQYSPTRRETDELRLTRIRTFGAMPAGIARIGRSRRTKAFVVSDVDQNVAYYYATTGRRQALAALPFERITDVQLAPKNDAILLASGDSFALAPLSDPHPEATMHGLFGKVWYEGYAAPTYEWESTGGTNEYEPKLSIMPLLSGTLKATVFAMLLAVPLAVLGAVFVSQFTHPRLRGLIKPIIEVMAAMPSVILGFIAALWLAPLLESGFTAFLMMFVVLPVAVLLAGPVWEAWAKKRARRVRSGSEIVVLMLAILGGSALCAWLDDPVESLLFGGDFPAFVYETLGLGYEQRNAVVIAIAMSFAVVPIIFSISEEALSNVPRDLISGSLALGATRWQTVVRVVLPTASPGVFSATMVGFGRAIGETMIVLMATGSTAIMDWNPFNGFRTLSANIAIEVSEAPVGGTLYRTLFLTALLLFALTFVINSVAELVRMRLRRQTVDL